jgi:CubicO group peptidase (beta-lactamase class C family)
MHTAIRRTMLFTVAMTVGLAAQSTFGAEPTTAWPVPDWQTARPAQVGLSADGLAKMKTWHEQNGSRTGLVVRHGRIAGEWYFGDAAASKKYLVFSTSKSFSSTAAGLLIADGKLSLDTTVGQVLNDVRPEAKQQVTIRQLLSMTSGVHNNKQLKDEPKIFDYALHQAPMDHPPGSTWDYNNTGLAILSPVIAKVAGQELDQVLDKKVFQPIGIGRDDWSWDQNQGHTLPYTGLHITARSLARFGLLFLNRGRWQEQVIVPADWVARATAPSQTMNPAYGYLWWNNSAGKWPTVPRDAYAALGAFDNDMLIVPSLDLIVVRQVGDDSASRKKRDIGKLWALAVEAIETPSMARR